MTTPDERMTQIVAEHSGEYTAVFEKVYTAAADGPVDVPWAEAGERHYWLRDWAADRGLSGAGTRALVVGCGYGWDAEFVASLGYATTAFDISPTAIARARDKHPNSAVDYVVADMFDAPREWSRGFDLVVEISTVQALPRSMRAEVTDAIGGFVAPGGQLILIMNKHDEAAEDGPHGPWGMTRAEVDAFAADGLSAVKVEERTGEARDGAAMTRWIAEFRR